MRRAAEEQLQSKKRNTGNSRNNKGYRVWKVHVFWSNRALYSFSFISFNPQTTL